MSIMNVPVVVTSVSTANNVPAAFRESRSPKRNTLVPGALLRQYVAINKGGFVQPQHAVNKQRVSSVSNTPSGGSSKTCTRRDPYRSPARRDSSKTSAGRKINKPLSNPKHTRIDTDQNTLYSAENHNAHHAGPRGNRDPTKSQPRCPTRCKDTRPRVESADRARKTNAAPAADINERVNLNLTSISSGNDLRVTIHKCGCRVGTPAGSEDTPKDPVQALREEISTFRNEGRACPQTCTKKTAPAEHQPMEELRSDYLNQLREEIFKYRKMACDHESELEKMRLELKQHPGCSCSPQNYNPPKDQDRTKNDADGGAVDDVEIRAGACRPQDIVGESGMEVELRLENLLPPEWYDTCSDQYTSNPPDEETEETESHRSNEEEVDKAASGREIDEHAKTELDNAKAGDDELGSVRTSEESVKTEPSDSNEENDKVGSEEHAKTESSDSNEKNSPSCEENDKEFSQSDAEISKTDDSTPINENGGSSFSNSEEAKRSSDPQCSPDNPEDNVNTTTQQNNLVDCEKCRDGSNETAQPTSG